MHYVVSYKKVLTYFQHINLKGINLNFVRLCETNLQYIEITIKNIIINH